MKRSEINRLLAEASRFIAGFGFALPPFADWTPAQISAPEAAPLRTRGLGWDVTDYGAGRFDTLGLLLFTLRNGEAQALSAGRGMLYAEKLLISRVDQIAPMHRHIVKAEDIINRGGGRLVVELFGSDAQGGMDRDDPVTVLCDGQARTFAPGGRLALDPGESVTLMPGDWHAFWAEGADVLIGEVSTVNDDTTDNIFAEPVPRYPQITEDAAPARLLVSDYPETRARATA